MFLFLKCFSQQNSEPFFVCIACMLRLHPPGAFLTKYSYASSTRFPLWASPSSLESAIFTENKINLHVFKAFMCLDQFWINQINFGIIVGPAGPLLVVKIGPAGPIFSPDQVFRDRPSFYRHHINSPHALSCASKHVICSNTGTVQDIGACCHICFCTKVYHIIVFKEPIKSYCAVKVIMFVFFLITPTQQFQLARDSF